MRYFIIDVIDTILDIDYTKFLLAIPHETQKNKYYVSVYMNVVKKDKWQEVSETEFNNKKKLMENGYFNNKLIIEKIDNNITIKMFNYLDEFQSNYQGEIPIKINNEEFIETMENGIIELELENPTGESLNIETMLENIRNGVLVIE